MSRGLVTRNVPLNREQVYWPWTHDAEADFDRTTVHVRVLDHVGVGANRDAFMNEKQKARFTHDHQLTAIEARRLLQSWVGRAILSNVKARHQIGPSIDSSTL